jgi:hypothetical protein
MKTKHLSLAGLLAAGALACALVLAGCENPGGGGGDGDDGDKTYALGDTGPGGGKIFYVSQAGFTMTDNGQVCHYLEAAPADMETTLKWASTAYESRRISGTETALGTGRKNTAIIVVTDVNAPAAKACDEYSNNGKTDWFLPSQVELDYLYNNRNSVGNLNTSTSYFSSSESDTGGAWHQSFGDGSQDDDAGHKDGSYRVRAVRAFGGGDPPPPKTVAAEYRFTNSNSTLGETFAVNRASNAFTLTGVYTEGGGTFSNSGSSGGGGKWAYLYDATGKRGVVVKYTSGLENGRIFVGLGTTAVAAPPIRDPNFTFTPSLSTADMSSSPSGTFMN